MFINFSNHPSCFWTQNQKQEALKYGEIRDISFPAVPPEANEEEIQILTESYIEQIMDLKNHSTDPCFVVHIMGEMTLSFRIIVRLKQENIQCMASTSKRITQEYPKGEKIAFFNFVRFRNY